MESNHNDEKRRIANAVAILAATCHSIPPRHELEVFIARVFVVLDYDLDVKLEALRRLHCSPCLPTLEDIRTECTSVLSGRDEKTH